MLQLLYASQDPEHREQGPPSGGPWGPGRRLLGGLLLLAVALTGGVVYCWLWLTLAVPAAPTLPLLGLVGLAVGLNGLAGFCWVRQPLGVAAAVVGGSILCSGLLMRLLLLCTFLFAFLF